MLSLILFMQILALRGVSRQRYQNFTRLAKKFSAENSNKNYAIFCVKGDLLERVIFHQPNFTITWSVFSKTDRLSRGNGN